MLISVRACKENAVTVLKDSRLGGPLLLFMFLLVFAFLGTLYLLQAVAEQLLLYFPTAFLLSPIMVGTGGLFVLIFLLHPLWHGVKMLLLHTLCFGKPAAEDVFFFFRSKKRYCYVLRYTVRFLLRALLYCGLLFTLSHLGYGVGRYLIGAEREAVALLILALSLIFVFLLSFFFFLWRADSFLMDATLLTATKLSYRQLHAISAMRMKRGRRLVWRMNLSFLPLFVLSIFMAGLPLFFVIPYYVVSRSCLAYRLFYG